MVSTPSPGERTRLPIFPDTDGTYQKNYVLQEDCPHLVETGGPGSPAICNIYDDPRKPAVCTVFEAGSAACRSIQVEG